MDKIRIPLLPVTRILLIAGLALACAGWLPSADASDAEAYFETAIRPIFAERCVECHGAEKQKNGLRLDSREGVLRGGQQGPALIAGDAAKSLLHAVLTHAGEVKMPPAGKLSDEELAAIDAWITLGAPWPKGPAALLTQAKLPPEEQVRRSRESHWAFQPVAEPTLPAVARASWVTSSIDRFVLARLEEADLEPSHEADRRTLLRRASYDLTGLPPTAAEIEDFENDGSPDAFAKVVTRLLESTAYGERWGRYWLDVARYADTKGYVFQQERNFAFSHTYRDYVIRALNEDLPYDTFIRQQLAADQMDLGEDKRPLAAMGFLTLGRRFIGNIHDITDDRIDVVTRGLLGLTVACARCHDHKYDPISMQDYYALYGVFRSSEEPGEPPFIAAPDPEDPEYQAFEKEVNARQADADTFSRQLHVDLLAHARTNMSNYLLAAHDARGMTDDEPLQALARDRDLRWQLVKTWRAFLEGRTDPADPVYGPWLAFAALPEEAFADGAGALAQRVAEGKYQEKPANPLIAKAFEGDPPASMAQVAERYGAVLSAVDAQWRDRLAAATQIAQRDGAAVVLPEGLTDPNAEAVRQAIYGPESPANVPVADVMTLSDVPTRDRVRQLNNAVDRVKATHPGRPDRAMSLQDAATLFDPYVFERGKAENKGPEVPRRFLSVLSEGEPAPFVHGSGRLDLANAIASRDNPLTARVMVNRIWMHHFGRPLADTPSDFGLRTAPPSHPELLDYLAWQFMENGWSLKALHRLIMLSSTYQQASEARPDGLKADPENRLLWRQNRRRLDFEAMRDSILFASGTLDRAMGGPSVDIVDPPYTTRRTVYSFIERQNLPSKFRTFDFAGPDTHSPGRFRTTVPQQALFMLNSTFINEEARRLAAREEVRRAACGDPRTKALYRLALQREPAAEECAIASVYIDQGPAEGPVRSPWRHGYGAVDIEAGRTASFTPLPHFTGNMWQGGPQVPDAALGWVTLGAGGGHPGNNDGHDAIRRWVAPVSGTLWISGTLGHASENGDGVQGWIVSSREGVLWSNTAWHGEVETLVTAAEVEAGDTIDFVTGCGENTSFDSFGWSPRIRMETADVDCGGTTAWAADTGFGGPEAVPLDAWERYAQVLLLANEFLFVD